MGTSIVDGLQIRCGDNDRGRRISAGGVYAKYARICCAVCHLENTCRGKIK